MFLMKFVLHMLIIGYLKFQGRWTGDKCVEQDWMIHSLIKA